MAHPYFSFQLPENFVEQYTDKKPEFGYPCGAGNSLGEILFLRSYSRKKEDGSKERWYEMCQRVIEGMYSIQKDHILSKRMRWNEEQGQRSAQEAFERFFSMKWTPPGRGMFAMGSPLVNQFKNSAPLYNCGVCAFDPEDVDKYINDACWLMEASALGIGVGFVAHPETKHAIYEPLEKVEVTNDEIAQRCGDPDGLDSREGWCESLRMLLKAYLKPNMPLPIFDYSVIRPLGAPLKKFGGTASGPASLIRLHDLIVKMFSGRQGQLVKSRDSVDLANMIAQCIVAGSMRRSALLSMGDLNDQEFVELKDWTLEKNAERMSLEGGWGSLSNNSIYAKAGMDYSTILDRTIMNGEPGFLYLDLAKNYGRLKDGYKGDDTSLIVTNPCAEIFLGDRELCCLSTIHLNKAEDKADFLRTVKFAYLYAKTVHLLSTHWPETNEVMHKNQRIGLSVTGIADFIDTHGWRTLREWLDEGYAEAKKWDEVYSNWLCVRRSIRITTVKPEGSVSILTGASAGGHFKTDRAMIRSMRFTKTDPIVLAAEMAGYKVEPDNQNPDSSRVVYFPVLTGAKRIESEVSIYEKAAIAADMQHWWADNAVSTTVTFDQKTESNDVERVLHMYEGRLKSISFLPTNNDGQFYEQMPEQSVPENVVIDMQGNVLGMDWNSIYNAEKTVDASDSKFCSNDNCEIV